MTKARLDVPEDWISRTLDDAVQRYANRTGELFYFSMKGHHEAVRHAYEDLGGEGQWWIPSLRSADRHRGRGRRGPRSARRDFHGHHRFLPRRRKDSAVSLSIVLSIPAASRPN